MLDNIIINDTSSLNIKQFEASLNSQLQQHITRVIAQVHHDIQSPLSCLLFLCMQQETNNSKRKSKIDPSAITTRINNIINSIPQAIQSHYNHYAESYIQKILPSNSIEKILAEKQYEYAKANVTFIYNKSEQVNNVYINVNMDAFERMLSNLINNAVEACYGKIGTVSIDLKFDYDFMYLTIIDNGTGMPDNIKNKVLNSIPVTANKLNGHGIGFQQITETLIASGANLNIESIIGEWTKIILTFPIIKEKCEF